MAADGGHGTLLDLLPGLPNLQKAMSHALGEPFVGDGEPHSTQILMSLVVVSVAVFLAVKAGFRSRSAEERMVPDAHLSARTLFEMGVEALLGLMQDIIGPGAERYLPLIASLATFILLSNLLGLVPGMLPPTDTLNTTLACAIPVFLATHYFGLRAHGWRYLKHFAGPVPLLAPLMIPIELVSHISRPISLGLRLFGNIMGDHMVLAIFVGLFPLFVPLPVLVLGVLVAFVQTMVFSLLSMVYIGLAVSHEEGH